MKQGPVLSKEIHNELVSHFSITSDNARKITSNLVKNGSLYAAKDLVFDSGSKLLYYKYDESEFRNALLKIKPYISSVLDHFNLFHIISKFNLFKLSAKPEDKNGKELSSLFKDLSFFYHIKYHGEYIVFSSFDERQIEDAIQKYLLYEKTDFLAISSIVSHNIQTNIINSKEIEYRSQTKAKVNYFLYMFDAVAKGVISDIVMNDVIYLYEVSTIKEVTTDSLANYLFRLNAVKKLSPSNCVGALVYTSISDEALKIARANNLMLMPLKRVFGNRIENILEIIKQKDVSIDDIDKAAELIKSTGQEENLGNIMGELFEYMVEKIVCKIYTVGSIVKRRFLFDHNSKRREIDIHIQTQNESVLIECKSSKNKVPLGEYDAKAKKTTKDSVKYFYDSFCMYKDKYNDSCPKFLIFAANGLKSEAIKYISKFPKKFMSSRLEYFYIDYKTMKMIADNKKWLDIKHELDCWKKFFLAETNKK